MGAHRFAGRFWIAFQNGRQDSLMMKLSALWSSVYQENPAALLAQKTDNGIQQRQNQRVSRRFGQRQMEVEIRFHISIGIMQAAIHHGHGFPHGAQQLFLNSERS